MLEGIERMDKADFGTRCRRSECWGGRWNSKN